MERCLMRTNILMKYEYHKQKKTNDGDGRTGTVVDMYYCSIGRNVRACVRTGKNSKNST